MPERAGGRRNYANLHDHHRATEQAGRANPQPHAGDPAARSVAPPLGEDVADVDDLLGMQRPFPAKLMRAYPVAKRVGSVRNNEPDLLAA